jgi:hypothetical protein
MLEVEIQKLTAAIEALTAELRSAKVGNSLPTETPTNLDKPRQRKPKVTPEEVEALVEAAKPVENPVCTDQPLKDEPQEVVSEITAEDLKTMAMEIARADSSTRTIILGILGEHGAKTITQLDPKNYRAVHARLMSLAHEVAQNGEPV